MRRSFQSMTPINRRESNSDGLTSSNQSRSRSCRQRTRTSLPFTSTPLIRGRNESEDVQVTASDETYDKLNEIVIKKTLRLFQCSPLYKFKFEKRFLKHICRKMSLFIQKEHIWGDVENALVPGARVVNIVPVVDRDEKIFTGIVVTVEVLSEYQEEEEGKQSTEFWGVLCRKSEASFNDEVQTTSNSNVINMPIFLVKGSAAVTNLVLNFFSKQFDCIIREMKISPLELNWLGSMWCGYPAGVPKKPFKLKYATPEEVTGIDTITYRIEAEDISNLWNSVHNKDSGDFHVEEKEALMKSLEAHIFTYLRIDLTTLTLIEIETTSIYAHCKGKVKLFSPETSLELIKYLISLVDQTQF